MSTIIKKIKAVITPDTDNPVPVPNYTERTNAGYTATDNFFLTTLLGFRIGYDAANNLLIQKTIDGGATYTDIYTGPNIGTTKASIHTSDGTNIFAFANGVWYSSADSGATFAPVVTTVNSIRGMSPLIGATWTNQDAIANPTNLSAWDSGATYNATDPTWFNGDIWTSINNGNTGNQPDTNPLEWLNTTSYGYTNFSRIANYVVGAKVYITSDLGVAPFYQQNVFTLAAFPAIISVGDTVLKASVGNFVTIPQVDSPLAYISNDFGASVKIQGFDFSNPALSGTWQITPTNNVDYQGSNILILNNAGAAVFPNQYLSADNGVSFTITDCAPNLVDVFRFQSFPDLTNGFVLDAAGVLYSSNDAGLTLNAVTTLTRTGITDMQFLDSSTGFLVCNDGGGSFALKTVNGGGTFEEFLLTAYPTVNTLFFLDANYGWLDGTNSNYFTTTGGDSSSYPYDILTWTFTDAQKKILMLCGSQASQGFPDAQVGYPRYSVNEFAVGDLFVLADIGTGENMYKADSKDILFGANPSLWQPLVFPVTRFFPVDYATSFEVFKARVSHKENVDYYLTFMQDSPIT